MIQGCLSGGRAAVSRGDLTDTEWRILNPLLPDRGERGPAIADKRRTMNGILWVLRTGAPWRDLPERYGKWNSAFVRFTRRRKRGESKSGSARPLARRLLHENPPSRER